MRVLQFSDLHLSADPAERVSGVPARESFLEVLALARREVPEPDLVVLTGDLAQDGAAATYRTVRSLFEDWAGRCRVVPGNHDDRQALRSVFADLGVGSRATVNFSESLAEWRLIGLDTLVPGEVFGGIGSEQVEWLADELTASHGQPTMLFMHHPPVAVGKPWIDELRLRDAGPLLSLIERSPQVRAMSCGHVHMEFEGRVGSTAVYTTPSTCSQFHRDPGQFYDDRPPGFRIFDFEGDHLTSRVLRVSGATAAPADPPGRW